MPTADNVKNKLQNLIAKSNAATGNSDPDLTTAMDTLITGYGSGGSAPSGAISITENGSHNVAEYATADVNVRPSNMVMRTIEIESTLGNGTNTTYTMLEADEFVKENFTKEGFAVIFVPANRIASASGNIVHGIFHGNRNIGAKNYTRYGVAYYSATATVMSTQPITSMLSANGTILSFRAKSNGDLILYVSQSRIVEIGTYYLWMCCIE